jgi:hypothetical protein
MLLQKLALKKGIILVQWADMIVGGNQIWNFGKQINGNS